VSRQLEREIRGSKRQLENSRELQPNGAGAVIRAGYDCSAAVKNAVSHLDDDPFAMARWIVTEQTTPARMTLGSRANAHSPFTIPLAIDATLFSVSTSLVAEGALLPERIPELARLLMRRAEVLPMLVRQLRSAPGAGESSKAIPRVAPDPERGAGTMS
jgi:hypothetical protein